MEGLACAQAGPVPCRLTQVAAKRLTGFNGWQASLILGKGDLPRSLSAIRPGCAHPAEPGRVVLFFHQQSVAGVGQ